MTVDVDAGRSAFARRAWSEAYARLGAADSASPLGLEDLERLAVAAELIGKDGDGAHAWGRAYHEALRLGQPARAARAAFWIGFQLLNRDQHAPAMGWLGRAERAVEVAGTDCVERGYLLLPRGLASAIEGRADAALEVFRQARSIAERFGDPDLHALATHGEGRALLWTGDARRGVALLDEVMVAVIGNEVSPIVTGTIYCSVIEACRETFDLRRAVEWTAALTRWCEAQPDLVLYRGQCRVYRAEIMQARGAWPDALEEVARAREHLAATPGAPALGAALYREGELHRLRGDLARAEDAYREATRRGASGPGVALLRLAQGETAAAEAMVRRMAEEARSPLERSSVLAALVEILLTAGAVAHAKRAAEELDTLARSFDAPLLRASALAAAGAVQLAEGQVREALAALRGAWSAWHELDAPYEAARTRALVGLACRRLGDEDGAAMEWDAARSVLAELGASVDLVRLDALAGPSRGRQGALTDRELQVLELLATGQTNRAIAAELFISERTVARHVSNIFDKLGVSTRTAATAYAYEHGLVGRSA